MTTAPQKLHIALAMLALSILGSQCLTAFAQGTTAFTYQGQLRDNGTNANGTYTLIFNLYDSPGGGNLVGGPISTSPILANGLFTVNLDFGASVFNGSARYLDITVTNGGVTQELSPRVQVLPSPYALFANTASNVVGGVATGTFIGNGSGLTNLDAVPQVQSFNTPGTYMFTVPANVTSVMVEVWGGGGGGGSGDSTTRYGGGGGGGGGYGKGTFNVTPGAKYTIVAGAGGASDSAGNASSFGALISAGGGNAGNPGSSATTGTAFGGTGGSSSASININGQTGDFSSEWGGNGGGAGRGGSGGEADSGSGNGAESGRSPGGGGGGGAEYNLITSNPDSGASGGNGEVIVYY